MDKYKFKEDVNMEFTREENLKYLKEGREMLNDLKIDCITFGSETQTEHNIIMICDSLINLIDNHIREAQYDCIELYSLRMTVSLGMESILLPLLEKQRNELLQLLLNRVEGAN